MWCSWERLGVWVCTPLLGGLWTMIQISEGFPTLEYQGTKTVHGLNLLTSQEKQQGIFVSQKEGKSLPWII